MVSPRSIKHLLIEEGKEVSHHYKDRPGQSEEEFADVKSPLIEIVYSCKQKKVLQITFHISLLNLTLSYHMPVDSIFLHYAIRKVRPESILFSHQNHTSLNTESDTSAQVKPWVVCSARQFMKPNNRT